jgi:hypothetical protein
MPPKNRASIRGFEAENPFQEPNAGNAGGQTLEACG